MGMVRACDQMLPRLVAEESLRAVEQLGVGTGSFTKEASKQVLSGWQADLAGTATKPARVYPTPAQLRAMGVKVFGAEIGSA